ncbi:MAG TPA: prepilin peptidase [Gemmatimonadaceae bacterium]|nr:prepilin peptidase [Gemmatimonadaceae bacterium]
MFSGSPTGVISGLAFVGLLLAACISDVRTRRIPNRIVAALAIGGVLYSILTFGASAGALRAVAGLGVGLAIWLPFHIVRLLGAGDVKLFSASGAWLGVTGALEGALLAALIGGALAIFWMVRARGVVNSARSVAIAIAAPSTMMHNDAKESPASVRLPYGVALAAGAAIVAWWPGVIFGS